MNRKVYLKTFILILIFMFVVLFNTTSFCEGNYSISMSLSGESQVSEGDTITLAANLNSIDAGDGVNAFSARLKYDSSLFEYVSVSGNNSWNTSFDSRSGSIIGFRGSKVTNPERVFTITLKTIPGLSADSSSVTIQSINFSGGAVSYGGTGDIRVSSTSTSFSILRETPVIEEYEEEVIEEEVIEEEVDRQVAQTTRNLDYTSETEKIEEQETTIEEQIQETQIIEQQKEEMPKALKTDNNNNNKTESFESIQVDKVRISKSVKTVIGVAGIILVLILGYKLFQKTKPIIL